MLLRGTLFVLKRSIAVLWPLMVKPVFRAFWKTISCAITLQVGSNKIIHFFLRKFLNYCLILTCCCCWVTMSCPTPCDAMDYSTPGSSVLHLLIFMSARSVMPSNHLILCHPLLLLPSVSLSQHQGLFQWVNSLLQVAKRLELQLQHQFSQWLFRVDFL